MVNESDPLTISDQKHRFTALASLAKHSTFSKVFNFFFEGKIERPKLAQIFIALALFFYVLPEVIFGSAYQLEKTEQGVELFLGKYHRTTGHGGLHFKFPFLTTVKKVETSQPYVLEIGFRVEGHDDGVAPKASFAPENVITITNDHNLVDIDYAVRYEITDPYKYLYSVRSPRKLHSFLAQTCMRTTVGSNSFDDVVTDGRQKVEIDATNCLRNISAELDYGISVNGTYLIQDAVSPSAEVRDAFVRVSKATDIRKDKINKGQKYANEAIPEARGKAEATLNRARAYAIQRVNEAKGLVAEYNAAREVYEDSPEITKKRLLLEAQNEIFKQAGTKIIVDGNNSSSILKLFNMKEAQ